MKTKRLDFNRVCLIKLIDTSLAPITAYNFIVLDALEQKTCAFDFFAKSAFVFVFLVGSSGACDGHFCGQWRRQRINKDFLFALMVDSKIGGALLIVNS